MKRPASDGPDGIGQLLVRFDAAERTDVLLGLLRDDVDDVVDGDDADEAVVAVDHRGGDQVVVLEQSCNRLLVVGGTDAMALGIHEFVDLDRATGTQQAVEGDGAQEALIGADDVDLVEAVGQLGGFAQIVDGVPDRPGGRHGNQLGLHAPAGRILRIIEASGERHPLGRRQLVEDLGLILLVEILQQIDGIVGIEFANAFGHRFRRQLLQNIFPHGIVDFDQGGEVEVGAQEFDQGRPQVGVEGFDEFAQIGFVQVADHVAQERGVGGGDRLGDAIDEIRAQIAVLVARRQAMRNGGRLGHVLCVEHAGARGNSRTDDELLVRSIICMWQMDDFGTMTDRPCG